MFSLLASELSYRNKIWKQCKQHHICEFGILSEIQMHNFLSAAAFKQSSSAVKSFTC